MVFLGLYLLVGLAVLIGEMAYSNWIDLYQQKAYSLGEMSLAALIIFIGWPLEVFLKVRGK